MFFATEIHPLPGIALSAGSFDDAELSLIHQIFSEAWRILCDHEICCEDCPETFEQREVLARVALDVFNGGEREIGPAARRCFENFAALARKR